MAKGLPRVALCIRKASSWAKQQPYHRVDRPSVFDPERTKKDLPLVAPGLVEMFDFISHIDKRSNKDPHKHFVFTDIASSGKFIAGAFVAMGFNLITHPDQDLTKSPYMNVALITSSTFADKPQEVKVRKRLLEIYNNRTENVDGKRIRFIILDSGFKEGIDLLMSDMYTFLNLYLPKQINPKQLEGQHDSVVKWVYDFRKVQDGLYMYIGIMLM
jgi:hypothetical protein